MRRRAAEVRRRRVEVAWGRVHDWGLGEAAVARGAAEWRAFVPRGRRCYAGARRRLKLGLCQPVLCCAPEVEHEGASLGLAERVRGPQAALRPAALRLLPGVVVPAARGEHHPSMTPCAGRLRDQESAGSALASARVSHLEVAVARHRGCAGLARQLQRAAAQRRERRALGGEGWHLTSHRKGGT